ncbi:MAG: hypothetical protein HWN65_03555 [Candidatus Helarchaeota archaeon]|nr:hypothetical protein [Candidatus Helarchaeota archaeon]
MSQNKKKYLTAQEIDGFTGIKSPHARELHEIGKTKVALFVKEKKRRIKIIVEEDLLGILEDLGFDEDYTLTLEYFPEVRSHIIYTNYEDEAFGGAELKFLFSGERVAWVPTEDLIGLLEASLDYLEDLLEDTQEHHYLPPEKSDLLNQSIKQRAGPFVHLKSEQLKDLASFIGGKIAQKDDLWELSKTLFQGFNIILIYDVGNKRLDVQYGGENILKINNYARDYLGIFLINHCLRFISITYPNIKMPKIVGQVFSYSYLKTYQKV